MKKITRSLAAIVCVTSIILAGCETPDGGMDIAWTLGFMALALATGLYLKKAEEK